MITYLLCILTGLVLLVWSADRFVEGSIAVATHLGMSPLLIGMIIVGFGTSAPEMIVSATSAFNGSPGIALGNAYGSNICNIALILGVTALIRPIQVKSTILKKELPILMVATLISIALLMNGLLSRTEAIFLLLGFSSLLIWSYRQQPNNEADPLAAVVEADLTESPPKLRNALFFLIIGLLTLIASSRLLVFGAVGIARLMGVSDLMIGLTIVALGTSLPELASSATAAVKNQHEIALGNIIGSNLFNTLAVVGIAGVIQPMAVDRIVLVRDMPLMAGLTLSLFIIGYGFGKKAGRINRMEGLILLISYLSYTAWLIIPQLGKG